MKKTRRRIRHETEVFSWLLKQLLKPTIEKHQKQHFDELFGGAFNLEHEASPEAQPLLSWVHQADSSPESQLQNPQELIHSLSSEKLWELTERSDLLKIHDLFHAELAKREGLIQEWKYLGIDQGLVSFILELKTPLEDLIARFHNEPTQEGLLHGQPYTSAPYFQVTHVLQLEFADKGHDTYEVALRPSGDAPTRGEFLKEDGWSTWSLTANGWTYHSEPVSTGVIGERLLTKFRVTQYNLDAENNDNTTSEESFFQHRQREKTARQLPVRLRILARELSLNNVHLPKLPEKLEQVFLEELHRCLTPHIHEGKTPPYCVAFLRKRRLLKEASRMFPIASDKMESMVKLANGGTSLLAYVARKKRFLLAFNNDLTPESELVRLSSRNDAVIIRRTADNETRIFDKGKVTIHKARNWLFKESSTTAVELVMQQAPMANRELLAELLDYAHHELSPRGIGATLIWTLKEIQVDGGHSIGMNLNIKQIVDRHLLTEYLAQTDGATLVRPDGGIENGGIHLTYSDKAKEFLSEIGGTRHTSARRFTYDHPESIAIVVSTDGPVSVFSDGIQVASLVMHSWSSHRVASALKDAVPSKAEDVFHETWRKVCSQCGKTSVIDEIFIYGWREDETASCPVCRSEIASSRCFSLSATPLKILP